MSDSTELPRRPLGQTGVTVSAIGLGGWHLSLPHVTAITADRIIRSAIERGIDFLDNCWDYNGGESERRMGTALAATGYRDRIFLMTKIDGRTKKEATKQLEDSLRRLRTDHIDLVQHHEILRYEDPDRIFASEGANEALLEAKAQGKLRFIGFTGHKDPRIHLHMLDVADQHGFKFDAVQMPLNVMDAHFRSFGTLVLPKLVDRGIAVLGMKPLANGKILETQAVTATECLHYALHLPTSVVITGCDTMAILDQAINAARTAHHMGLDEVQELLARTAPFASNGQYEQFKTTAIYDGTAENPHWLG